MLHVVRDDDELEKAISNKPTKGLTYQLTFEYGFTKRIKKELRLDITSTSLRAQESRLVLTILVGDEGIVDY